MSTITYVIRSNPTCNNCACRFVFYSYGEDFIHGLIKAGKIALPKNSISPTDT